MKPSRIAHLHLRQKESIREGILRIAASLAEASTPLPPTSTPTAIAKVVHETRLALKQARALIRLVRDSLDRTVTNRLAHRLRQAARRLAESRDATVGLRLLDDLAERERADPNQSPSRIRAQFAAQVHDQTHSASETHRALAHARRTLRSTSITLARVRWKHRGWRVLETGLDAGYRRARKRFRAARKEDTDATFHAWRTASKSLYYQLGLVQPIAHRRLRRLLDDLNALQSELGGANDVATLLHRLKDPPDTFGAPDAVARTLDRLSARQRRLHQSALRHGRRLFATSAPDFLARLAQDWKTWRKS